MGGGEGCNAVISIILMVNNFEAWALERAKRYLGVSVEESAVVAEVVPDVRAYISAQSAVRHRNMIPLCLQDCRQLFVI